ncbi:MAG: hypothetical protein WBB98_04855 [Xanthobacteraceae bacterium]
MPRLPIDARQAEIAAATEAERADWERRVNAWLFGVDIDQWLDDERVDAEIYERDGETVH